MAPVITAASGVDTSFERVYRKHARAVYSFAVSMLGNREDAEDVTQTTFLNAYRALGRGERVENPRAWLLAIAQNVCRQRFRTAARRPQEVEFHPGLAEGFDLDDAPSAEEISAALGRLMPRQRKVIVLREIEGRSYAEIAEAMDLSVAAVETLLFRARRALREELERADVGVARPEPARRKAVGGVLPIPSWLASAVEWPARVVAAKGAAALVGATVIGAGVVGPGMGESLAAADGASGRAAALAGKPVAEEPGPSPATVVRARPATPAASERPARPRRGKAARPARANGASTEAGAAADAAAAAPAANTAEPDGDASRSERKRSRPASGGGGGGGGSSPGAGTSALPSSENLLETLETLGASIQAEATKLAPLPELPSLSDAARAPDVDVEPPHADALAEAPRLPDVAIEPLAG